MIKWGETSNVWWLCFLLLIVYLSVRVFRWREKTRKEFADENLHDFVFTKGSTSYFKTKLILGCLALLFIILALMDPLMGEEEKTFKREGVDIVFVLDLSTSMDTEDVAPNRLDKAIKVITNTIEKLKGDRIALVVFASDAYTFSPLTNDYVAIESYLNGLNTSLISKQGTNFYRAIEQTVETFQGVPNTSKLAILISDGEDNEESVNRSIILAKESNIHILSLGVGTTKGGPIPIKSEGITHDFKKDNNGQIVISKLEEKSLIALSEKTNGVYENVQNIDVASNTVIKYLSRLDKNEIDTMRTKDMKHVYQWFLGIAILLLFIESLTVRVDFFK